VRVVYSNQSNGVFLVKQVNSYYPFGMNIKGLTANEFKINKEYPINEYLYNGKMFQDELGLDWLDYGARMYDAVLGRFHSVDPLAAIFASQSPYCYAANNPIKFIDYMGMNPKLGDDVGADGLTNKQWIESSRPGADPGLGSYYRNFNRNIESEKKFNGLQEDKNGNYFYYKQKSRKWGGMYRFSGKSYLYFGPGLEVVLEKMPLSADALGQLGGLGMISTVFGATSIAGNLSSKSSSTFRLVNSKGEFSPKVYTPKVNRPYGWKGGFGITTYSISKLGERVSFGSSILTTGDAYYDIAIGQQQPITYIDAGVGTVGLMNTIALYYTGVQVPYVGAFVALYGTGKLTWDVFFYLGANYGVSTWFK